MIKKVLEEIANEPVNLVIDVIKAGTLTLFFGLPFITFGGVKLYEKTHPKVRQFFPRIYECDYESCPGHDGKNDECYEFWLEKKEKRETFHEKGDYYCTKENCKSHKYPDGKCWTYDIEKIRRENELRKKR